MRRIFLSTLIILVFTVFLSIITDSLSTALAENSLDGKTFEVKVSEQGQDGEPTADELIFKEGTFFSTDCEQYGFRATPYKATAEGDKTMFESTLMSKKEGKADWKGTVDGNSITGTFVWSKEGQDPIKYEFQGNLKK